LNNPDRKVKVGDKYGYDYYANVRNHRAWVVAQTNVGALEATLAGEAGYQTFWRDGLYRKGLFPDNSYGESEKSNFFTYTAKLGLNYKFEGSNRLYANIGYVQSAPYFQESFLSPRTRNSLEPHLTTEKTFSTDLNYALKVGEFAQGKAVFGALVICIVLAGLLLLANYYLPYRGLRWISRACTFTGFLVAAPLFVIHFLPGIVVQFIPEAAELSHVLDGFYSVMAPYHFMPLIIGLALAVVATLWKRIYRKQMAQQ
jgi:hypothetical protein